MLHFGHTSPPNVHPSCGVPATVSCHPCPGGPQLHLGVVHRFLRIMV